MIVQDARRRVGAVVWRVSWQIGCDQVGAARPRSLADKGDPYKDVEGQGVNCLTLA